MKTVTRKRFVSKALSIIKWIKYILWINDWSHKIKNKKNAKPLRITTLSLDYKTRGHVQITTKIWFYILMQM